MPIYESRFHQLITGQQVAALISSINPGRIFRDRDQNWRQAHTMADWQLRDIGLQKSCMDALALGVVTGADAEANRSPVV